MKATLEFDLDNPDDRESHLRCLKATDMACVLFEFMINSRKRIAYKLYEEASKDKILLDIVYEEFDNLIEEHNININELIS